MFPLSHVGDAPSWSVPRVGCGNPCFCPGRGPSLGTLVAQEGSPLVWVLCNKPSGSSWPPGQTRKGQGLSRSLPEEASFICLLWILGGG